MAQSSVSARVITLIVGALLVATGFGLGLLLKPKPLMPVPAQLAVNSTPAPATSQPNAISAQLIGCFTDDETRALPTQLDFSGNATIESCVTLARQQGFAYAGLQFGGQCFGGNTLGYTQTDLSECATPCAANAAETCGGTWHNSIYATGIAPPATAIPNTLPLQLSVMPSAIGSIPTDVAKGWLSYPVSNVTCHAPGVDAPGLIEDCVATPSGRFTLTQDTVSTSPFYAGETFGWTLTIAGADNQSATAFPFATTIAPTVGPNCRVTSAVVAADGTVGHVVVACTAHTVGQPQPAQTDTFVYDSSLNGVALVERCTNGEKAVEYPPTSGQSVYTYNDVACQIVMPTQHQ